ncbi:helix-turn-helix domain-containing protein [Companilactobacillus sp.]|jgi:transcriptional regulator with XRE-family HTH domain|uniref:helix-turn-helix domain-containing protein n=1 Tax=Companilactobacillus sp. TaxID=2767905 RepID=UPI0025B88A4A|nr:helix-turn-helix transcriptional regulator [Companilactobacillus sp.]MCH4008108.1 helix-turn-helix domain-containing protein [Companilactobacillus sp.]MCH4051713.1 helix-turn-helix domain-containing protein [Companilactobacillus sp.]MCH4076051.1 helix-turn-helix domain-containing protein [Companilactobacillus sp.]MCH4124626.1 helix-turn-helix domain-containing protein [Companilactobacillus sp.]MCH4132411.1 helix-turn-helix domain-containing protein [Companilactobacillus sp.]
MTTLDRIKKISKQRGFSLTKVNDMANLGTNTIYSWKHKEPGINNLKAVANVLHVSVDYLLGKTDDPDINAKSKKVDIKDAMQDDYTIMSYGGREIPPEELEMIRRILDGGK